MTITLSLALALGVATWVVAQAQTDFNIPSRPSLPSGPMGPSEADKRVQEQITKDDTKKNTVDADNLLSMALELKAEVAKSSTQSVSVKAFKDAKEIEKLAKSIRGRLNRDYKDIRFAPIGQAQ